MLETREGAAIAAVSGFAPRLDLDHVLQCNCSICTKTGILHLAASPADFELLCGKNALTVYTFETGVAQHTFCAHCGMHAFYVPRSQPDKVTVNARCLDGIDGSALAASGIFRWPPLGTSSGKADFRRRRSRSGGIKWRGDTTEHPGPRIGVASENIKARCSIGEEKTNENQPDRILTSHVGSLPRPEALIAANQSHDSGQPVDEVSFQQMLRASVADVVRQQHELGIDIPGDGEFGKSMGHRVNFGAWMNYAYHRLGGLDLAGPDMHDVQQRRSGPGHTVLTSFADRRDRTRFRGGIRRSRIRRFDRSSAPHRPRMCWTSDLHRRRRDQDGHRQFQGSARGRRIDGGLHVRHRTRQHDTDEQPLL